MVFNHAGNVKTRYEEIEESGSDAGGESSLNIRLNLRPCHWGDIH